MIELRALSTYYSRGKPRSQSSRDVNIVLWSTTMGFERREFVGAQVRMWHIYQQNDSVRAAFVHCLMHKRIVKAEGASRLPFARRLTTNREPRPFASQREVAGKTRIGWPCMGVQTRPRLEYVIARA